MHPVQYPSHLWQPVSHVPETGHVPLDDELQLLNFADDFSLEAVKQLSPIQRRIQAFGATMEENDWMESQQTVIVSKYFRNTKDATYFKSVRDTERWHSVKDDPAFADIATHGAIVAFEELYQRKADAIVSRYSVAEAYHRRQSNSSAADDQDGDQNFPPHQATGIGLSKEQEERLAALGVTGDPKPVTHIRIPKKEECRSRSRSPETTRQPKQSASYRQRRKSLGVAMSSNESGRNDVELGFQQRDQENQNRGQGQGCKKTEEKSKQQQQHSRRPSRKTTRRQRQRQRQRQRRQLSRPQSPNNASTKALESSPRRSMSSTPPTTAWKTDIVKKSPK
ncbi:hypothetical protein AYO22_11275 [Fonsecaea multimorphosa]|nr:hypothetical protein AYO22_11275 [Fonsecaea multimorphosa]